MRAIKKEDIENNTYYQTPKWLFDLLLEGKITPGAYCLYVLMYDRTRISLENNWVDKDGEIYIEYSWESMRKNRKVKSNTQIKRDLEKLYELNLLQVKRQYRDSNIYYLNIYSENTESKIIQIVEDEKQVELHNLCESDYTICTNEITQIVDGIKNNSSKNNLNKIMNHEEHDFFENLFKTIGVNFTTTNQKSVKKLLKTLNRIQVKEYLLETYENMKTNPNIENIEGAFSIKIMTGERQSKYKEPVVDVPKSEIEFQENKALERGHKFNSEAIDSTIEAKEAKEEYTAKIDRLQGIYQVLSDTEKKKVDDEAYQLAVKQYGPTVAKIMARTKTKFEILEKYYLLKKGA